MEARFGKELEKIDIPKYRGNYIQYNVSTSKCLEERQNDTVADMVDDTRMLRYVRFSRTAPRS